LDYAAKPLLRHFREEARSQPNLFFFGGGINFGAGVQKLG